MSDPVAIATTSTWNTIFSQPAGTQFYADDLGIVYISDGSGGFEVVGTLSQVANYNLPPSQFTPIPSKLSTAIPMALMIGLLVYIAVK